MPDSKKFPLSQSLDLALSGKGAPPDAVYKASLAKADAALVWLKEQASAKTLELLGIPSRTDDLKAAQKVAADIKGMKTVAVLGIGGSSLGGQALTALAKKPKGASASVEFHDNPDPFSWEAALKRFDLKKTHFIAISKSGGTAETLMQALTAAEALKKAGVKSLNR
jgi:glucose-6-phosphate isomerase